MLFEYTRDLAKTREDGGGCRFVLTAFGGKPVGVMVVVADSEEGSAFGA
jgi:hypothetical protein